MLLLYPYSNADLQKTKAYEYNTIILKLEIFVSPSNTGTDAEL